ncbi:MAG TPA: glycosyltransferase WbuB [Steroidobacteraceae bacterium]|nr:glycosyltransferase WbuB [Steroidobacteraceae bacterium]
MANHMRILIYSCNFSPERIGVGKYSGEMAEWLVDQGHSVRVIAAPPYYPGWKVDPAYLRPRYRRERLRGIDVWRAPLWVPRSPGGLARVLHLLSFAFTSFPLMVRQISWRPELIITVAPAFVCAPAALLVARLCGAQKWLHLQDFEVDLAFRMGLLKGKLLQRLVLRMESAVLRRFDSVSSISLRMVERLLTKGVAVKRTRYFPNWVDISRIKPSLSGAKYRAQLGVPAESLVVLFSGSLGGKQGLMIIPAAARLLAERKDIVFVVCGDGIMKAELQEAAAGLSNVYFLPLQPFERLGELLAMADIHLLPQRADAADLVLPSKLSGMLASGRPVIAACRSGTEIDAVVSQCGMVVPPQDPAALGNAICKIADDPRVRLDLGRCARAYAESNFERETILRRIFGDLDADVQRVADDAIA